MKQEEYAARIAKHYNRIMRPGKSNKGASTDVDHILNPENYDKFVALEPYFDSHLSEMWYEWRESHSSVSDEVRKEFIGSFVQYGLLEAMHRRRYNYEDMDARSVERYCMEHFAHLQDLLVEENEEYHGKLTSVGIELFKNTGKYGDDYPCESEKRRLLLYYYDKIKTEIGE